MNNQSRNYIFLIITVVIVLLLLSRISTSHKSSDIPSGADLNKPGVISTSFYDIDGDGKKEIIEIMQTKGSKMNDQEPWCGMGEKWQGHFIVQVLKDKTVLDRLDLNQYMGNDTKDSDTVLSFWAPNFSLVLEDYNNDSDIDFNLGQYGICEGNDYWLFTIRKNGKIEPLPFEGRTRSIFIPGESHDNSTDKIQIEGGLIKRSSYDRDQEIEYTDWFKWNGRNFVADRRTEKSDKEPFKDYLIQAEQLVGKWISGDSCEVILERDGAFRAESVTGRWFVRDNRLTWIYDKDYKGFTKGQEDINIIVDFEPGKFLLREKSGAFTTFKKLE